jgi:ABC-type lipoprotein export system ATPase subunit
MNDLPPSGHALIEVVDVHKSYLLGRRVLEILRGLSLKVERGESLAIRGASGAGKSTLLHLLGGLDRPTLGQVCFDGREVSRLSRGELARFRASDSFFRPIICCRN